MVSNDATLFVKAQSRFAEHFDYYPNHPNELDFDVKAYSNLLDRCIADNFDYTIELYGTKPIKMRHRKPNEPIID